MSTPDYSFETQINDMKNNFRENIRDAARKEGAEGTEAEIDQFIRDHSEELNKELQSMFSGMFYGPTLGQRNPPSEIPVKNDFNA